MTSLLEGVALGLAYAMPIGMQNVFVIQQAVSNSKKRAYLTAASVSVADVSLAFACFFGVGQILIAIPLLKWVLLLGGAAFLIWTGFSLVKSKQTSLESESPFSSNGAIIRAAFLLTWLNPHAVVDGSILLGSYSAKLSAEQAPRFLIGLTLASPLWFFTLTTIGAFAGRIMTPKRFLWLNRIAGTILICLAIGLIKTALT